VRKSKKPVRREPPAWEVYRFKSSPAAFIGLVYAEDEEDRDRDRDRGTQSGRSEAAFLPNRVRFPSQWSGEDRARGTARRGTAKKKRAGAKPAPPTVQPLSPW
jgi:hypothetical protein